MTHLLPIDLPTDHRELSRRAAERHAQLTAVDEGRRSARRSRRRASMGGPAQQRTLTTSPGATDAVQV